jgi:hypothetical protein
MILAKADLPSPMLPRRSCSTGEYLWLSSQHLANYGCCCTTHGEANGKLVTSSTNTVGLRLLHNPPVSSTKINIPRRPSEKYGSWAKSTTARPRKWSLPKLTGACHAKSPISPEPGVASSARVKLRSVTTESVRIPKDEPISESTAYRVY